MTEHATTRGPRALAGASAPHPARPRRRNTPWYIVVLFWAAAIAGGLAWNQALGLATTWTYVDSEDGALTYVPSSWSLTTGTGCDYAGSDRFSNTATNTVSATFTGKNAVEVGYVKYTGAGIFTVAIDGVTVETVDGYGTHDYDCQTLAGPYIVSTASHTITATVTGTKNGASSGYYLNFDFFRTAPDYPVAPTSTPGATQDVVAAIAVVSDQLHNTSGFLMWTTMIGGTFTVLGAVALLAIYARRG